MRSLAALGCDISARVSARVSASAAADVPDVNKSAIDLAVHSGDTRNIQAVIEIERGGARLWTDEGALLAGFDSGFSALVAVLNGASHDVLAVPAITAAAYLCVPSALRLLVALSPHMLHQAWPGFGTPLHAALRCSLERTPADVQLETIKAILDLGADVMAVKAVEGFGLVTPLQLVVALDIKCARAGRIIALLLDRGADHGARLVYSLWGSRTPLLFSVESSNAFAVAALLAGGASPNERELSATLGLTALMIASRTARTTTQEIIRSLCKAGAELEARFEGPDAGSSAGLTAVGFALRAQSVTALRALSAAGANLDALQGSGPVQATPLWLALDRGDERIAHELLSLGASAPAGVVGPGGQTLVELAERRALQGFRDRRPGSLVVRLEAAAAGVSVRRKLEEVFVD